jgi:hypothetical protein
LKPVELAREYSGDSTSQRAAAKIREHFEGQMKPLVERWNAKKKSGGRTLLIEPGIEQIKFVSGGKRVFAGAWAGSSAVVMKVKYSEASTGKVIAYPEFFQRAAAMSGAFTFGGQDNAMLGRIVTLITDYSARNYEERVGGPNGMEEQAAAEQ